MYLLAIIWLWNVIAAEPDPCKVNEALNVGNERGPSSTTRPGQNPLCDIWMPSDWYRIKGPFEIDLDMAMKNPKEKGCSTDYPIWLRDKLPPVGSIGNLTTCLQVATEACSSTNFVLVKNCGKYRVYQLHGPAMCPAAFCFDIPQVSTGIVCPGKPVDQIEKPQVIPLIGDSEQRIGKTVVEEVQFSCSLKRVERDKFYDVSWFINGISIAFHSESVSGKNVPFPVLREKHWYPRFHLGMKVKCAIAVRANNTCLPGNFQQSQEFFAGLKVLNPSVSVTQGELIEVKFRSTVPIACLKKQRCQVYFNAPVSYSANHCPPSWKPKHSRQSSFCGPVLHSDSWRQIVHMNVTGVVSPRFDDTVTQIEMVGTRHLPLQSLRDIWGNVRLPSITVNVLAKHGSIKGARCAAINDPHMTRFDGIKYENHLFGKFILFRHKKLPYSAQTIQKECNFGHNKPIACNCGIAMQAGEEILVISSCDAKNHASKLKLTRTKSFGCSKGGLRVIQKKSSSIAYDVIFPTGTKVVLTEGFQKFMNIEVYPSQADLRQIEGLCGPLGENPPKKFFHRDGKVTEYKDASQRPDAFIKSWRAKPNEDLYMGKVPPNQGVYTFCQCESSGNGKLQMDCTNYPPRQDCLAPHDKDVTKRHFSSCRTRRESDEFEPEEIDLPELTFDIIKEPEHLAWKDGWNENKARDFCMKYLTDRPIYSACQAVPHLDTEFSLNGCVLDIMATGQTVWASSALESYKTQCGETAARNASLWVATDEEPSVFETVANNSCPSECSDHGACVNGTCSCERNYVGTDCSIDITVPPTLIERPNSGLCSKASRRCGAIRIQGDPFLESPELKCKMDLNHVNRHGLFPTGRTVFTDPVFINRNELICPLPMDVAPEEDSPQGDPPLGEPYQVSYSASVTNNGKTYSQMVPFVPVDSCMDCSVQGRNMSCHLRKTFCYINHVCVSEGSTKEGMGCLICDPTKSTLQWTYDRSQDKFCYINDECITAGSADTGRDCFICNITENRQQWSLTKTFCYINHVCVSEGSTKEGMGCLICDPKKSTQQWTYDRSQDQFCYINDQCIKAGSNDTGGDCFICNIREDRQKWSLAENFCYIKDVCLKAGSKDPKRKCFLCDPTQGRQQWTYNGDVHGSRIFGGECSSSSKAQYAPLALFLTTVIYVATVFK